MPPDRPTWSGPPRHVTFLFVHTPSNSHATPMSLFSICENYKIRHKSLIYRTKFLSNFFAARSISKI